MTHEHHRHLEPYTIDSIQWIGESIALISTEGVIFCRPANTFNRIPEVGEQLQLETIQCSRVTGLADTNGNFLFRYTDQELANQDRIMHQQLTEYEQKNQ